MSFKRAQHQFHEDENEPEKPFYQQKKIKADPKAMANYDALPRPKAPPGRKPVGDYDGFASGIDQ